MILLKSLKVKIQGSKISKTRAKSKNEEKIFLRGCRRSVSGGGRRGGFIGRGSRQKKFGFRPKGTAILQFQRFRKRLPRGFAARQARKARQSPILRGFATLRVAKRKRLDFGFGSSFGRSPKQNEILQPIFFHFAFGETWKR